MDDEPSLLVVMEQYLRRLGYDVVACRTGQEAWLEFLAEPSSFVLVLADATLPDTSATELLEKMVEANPKVRMLVCSGYPFDMASLQPVLREKVGFLQKPFTPRRLAGAVQRLLAVNQS